MTGEKLCTSVVFEWINVEEEKKVRHGTKYLTLPAIFV